MHCVLVFVFNTLGFCRVCPPVPPPLPPSIILYVIVVSQMQHCLKMFCCCLWNFPLSH